jgi:hypothetical protein
LAVTVKRCTSEFKVELEVVAVRAGEIRADITIVTLATKLTKWSLCIF